MEKLILVDKNDCQIGIEEKIKTHKLGLLHRAFSIFIFNSNGELMLQKRDKNKYHCGGLWSNTCCSHPREGENVLEAAHRRLQEEMGLDCELKQINSFIYQIAFENGLIENEFDHIIIGKYDKIPKLNSDEAEDWKWIDLKKLKDDIKINPKKYTYWLITALKKIDFRNI